MAQKIKKQAGVSTPIVIVRSSKYKQWFAKQNEFVKNYLESSQYSGKIGSYCQIPGKNGYIELVLIVIADKPDIWSITVLANELKGKNYHIESDLSATEITMVCLGFRLGCYSYDRYRKQPRKFPSLTLPKNADRNYINITSEAVFMVRDLTNTPTEDMTPRHLALNAKKVAAECKATFREIAGDDLLKHNYPTIHTVGRASVNTPRLIDIRWGNKKHPKITLVGKGVCFDSGGLDIKGASNMLLMKKDMAGGAHALALGMMIMKARLPVNLRILIPAVENCVAGNAFRPLDVIKTRKGITVEIGNTDAEGRLILCDALAEADSEKPDLLLDFATLTGAARTALGTEIPALFSNDEKLAADMQKKSLEQSDPFWQLPLWPAYRDLLNSKVADINNAGDLPYAGAITAALYLKEFVTETKSWAHFDMMAWNLSSKPGRPAGAEAQVIRAVFEYIKGRFGK